MKMDEPKTINQGGGATIVHPALSPEFVAQNSAYLADGRITEEKH